jgi:hypothetical protein
LPAVRNPLPDVPDGHQKESIRPSRLTPANQSFTNFAKIPSWARCSFFVLAAGSFRLDMITSLSLEIDTA